MSRSLLKLLFAFALLLSADAAAAPPQEEEAAVDETHEHSEQEMAEAKEEFEVRSPHRLIACRAAAS